MNSVLEQLENRRLLAVTINNGLTGDSAVTAIVDRGGIVTSLQYGTSTNVMNRYEAFLDLGPNRTVWGTTNGVVPFSSALFNTTFFYAPNGDVSRFVNNQFGPAQQIGAQTAQSTATIWLNDANNNKRPDDGYITITATTTLPSGSMEVQTSYTFETVSYQLTEGRLFQYQDANIGTTGADDVLIVQGSLAQNSLAVQTIDPTQYVWVGQTDEPRADAGASPSGFAADAYDDLITSILAGGFDPLPTGDFGGLAAGTFPGLGSGYGADDITTAIAYQFERSTDVTIATNIRLFTAADVPVMQVWGNGVFIPDGDMTRSVLDGTDFGLSWSAPVEHTFEIHNVGRKALVFSDWPPVQILGPNADDFRIIREPSPRVAEGGVSLFKVQFIPTGAGTRSAFISIQSNDLTTTPYTFEVFGGSGPTVQPDVYEFDGGGLDPQFNFFNPQITPGIAKVVSTDGVWKVHSIHRNDDVDWSVFEIPQDTDVLIQTTSPIGDTRLYVYDALGNQVGYDNDSGAGLNAATYLHLRRGVYYTRVDEFGENATIPFYALSVVARPGVQVSDLPIYLDGAGRLFVYGSSRGDTIGVDVNSGAVRVSFNDSQVFFPLPDVKSVFVNGRAGADTIYVGLGVPPCDVRGSFDSDAITIDTTNGSTVFGGDGNDVIFGSAGTDYINGKNGIDIIYAGAGDDYLQGGDGDDVIYGGDGNDTILGFYGNDVLNGDAGDDVILGGPESIPAGITDNDTIHGGDGDDVISGGPGTDTMFADAGANQIAARDGEVDTIYRDVLTDVVDADPNDVILDSSSALA